MRSVDVAIIGAGTAGLSARRQVAAETDNYVVIDPGPLGTTCARVGCMPSKVLIQIANDFHSRLRMQGRGVKGADSLRVSIPEVFTYVRELRDAFVAGVLEDIAKWSEQHFVPKRARFLASDLLDCEGEQIRARNIIVATGSVPIIPTAWEPYRDDLFTTDDIFEVEDLPSKIAVIGLGVIGLETGQALQRLGIDVHGFSVGKALGGLSDPELQELAAKILSQELPMYFEGANIVGREKGQLIVEYGEERDSFDKALIAVGRRPNTEGLGFEDIGIELNKNGVPDFNKETYRVGNHNIFLAGDVLGVRPVLHEASDEGHIVGYNAARKVDQCFARRTELVITFSSPEIALIGQSYQKLVDSGRPFVSAEVDYSNQGRARIQGKNRGKLKLYADPKTGQLLGAEMIAPDGEHLAHLLAWGISLKASVQQLLSMPFYHPVTEEGLRKALRGLAAQISLEKEPLEIMRCQDVPVEHL